MWTRLKHEILLNSGFCESYVLCICYNRLAEAIINTKTNVFLTNNMGITMKNTRYADFCADQVDVITNISC